MKLNDFAPILWPDPISPRGAVPPNGPIDLVHLSQQTLGDHALEQELLGIFERQTNEVVAALDVGASEPARRRHADLAHLITGSARAIGAFRLAAAAQAYEHALRNGAGHATSETARAAVCATAREACAAVARLIGNEPAGPAETVARLSPKL